MSRAELPPIAELPRNPARRRALFDLALGAAALPTLPALAQKPPAPPPLRVMHGFADNTGITLWLQGARAEALEIELRKGENAAAPVAQTIARPLEARGDFTESVVIGGLEPGEQYAYAVRAPKAKATLARGTFRTQ